MAKSNNLTDFERETIIRFSDDDSSAQLYTASERVSKLLIKDGNEPIQTTTDSKGAITGWFFEIHKSAVRVKPHKNAINIGGSK